MEAEIESTQLLETRNIPQCIIGIQRAVRVRCPARTGQIQLVQPGETADLFQILGVDDRVRQIDTRDVQLPWRKVGDVPHRGSTAIEDDATTSPDDPFRDLTLGRARTGGRYHQPQKREENSYRHTADTPF